MPLWKLVPTTHPADPRWLNRPIYKEVLIRAPTAGVALRLAARFELGLDDTSVPHHAVGNGTERLGSSLEDGKLYRLLSMEPGDTEDTATAHPLLGDAVLKAVLAPVDERARNPTWR